VTEDADVVVIGGGISGLGAALRLQDLGLRPLVLESDTRVGGRMTSDRVNGFVIDRGVTLFGRRFHGMRALTRRLGLDKLRCPARFSFGLDDGRACRSFRGQRPDDLLLDPAFSWAAKRTFARLGLDLARRYRALEHGRSDRADAIDDVDVATYLSRLGAGGGEVLRDLFAPGLSGPHGGPLDQVSRAIFMQTVWNMLVEPGWNLTDGVDRIPEAVAAQVPVTLGARVTRVWRDGRGVRVEAETADGSREWRTRAALFAIPGHLPVRICTDLPEWITEPLSRVRYARMANAHVALRRAPKSTCIGYAFAPGVDRGVELELEHLRAPGRCPEGAGMVSAFYWDAPEWPLAEQSDESLSERAVGIVEKAFPEIRGETQFVHVVRWETGICRFPPGRLREMTALRRRLAQWDGVFDLAGDYLDGISSEGALRTGEQAAERIARRLRTWRGTDG
jgi:oxygen-dependent protoporphyrinogen oxidase